MHLYVYINMGYLFLLPAHTDSRQRRSTSEFLELFESPSLHRGSSLFIDEICQWFNVILASGTRRHGGKEMVRLDVAFETDEVNRADIRDGRHTRTRPIFTSRQFSPAKH